MDRATCTILGCHVVGERAVEIVQLVAIAMSAGMRVDDMARVPLSFPTYAGILGRAAYRAAQRLDLEVGWRAHEVEDGPTPDAREAPDGGVRTMEAHRPSGSSLDG